MTAPDWSTIRGVPGIYTITHQASGRRYVGSSKDMRRRWLSHQYALRNGSHPNRKLQRAWAKYGEVAFEFNVLETLTDQADQLYAREQHWMDELHPEFNMGTAATGRPQLAEEVRRVHLSMRISPECAAILNALASHFGLSQAGTIEKCLDALVAAYPDLWPGGLGPYPPLPFTGEIE